MASNPKFHALLKQMAETHDKKNADYSHGGNYYSNFEEAATAAGTDIGTVFRTMIGIKLARLNALSKEGKPPLNESVQDTLLDLAVYAALYASYFLDTSPPLGKIQPNFIYPSGVGSIGGLLPSMKQQDQSR